MSRSPTREAGAPPRFPRVSGDEPCDEGAQLALIKFSPRERG